MVLGSKVKPSSPTSIEMDLAAASASMEREDNSVEAIMVLETRWIEMSKFLIQTPFEEIPNVVTRGWEAVGWSRPGALARGTVVPRRV